MTRYLSVIVLAVLAPLGGRPLEAQTARELVAQGVAAYRALELDLAADRLHRALAVDGTGALPDSVRAGTHIYLGAIEVLRGRSQTAAASFQNALKIDPRHRPDPLIFPPEISDRFEAVRRGTRYVRVEAPDDTTIKPGVEHFPVRLYASASHRISVDLLREDGEVAWRLFDGLAEDSLDIRWDGLDESGGRLLEGRLVMEITSLGPGGATRVVRLPLTVRAQRLDSLAYPHPPTDSQVRPRAGGAGPAIRAATMGLLSGLAVVVLPEVVADGGDAASTRYVVGGALSVAGLIGLITDLPGSSRGESAVANQELRDAWRREVAEVRAENERRRASLRVEISTGESTVIEREGT